ncbi:MAG: hypothetical protein RLZZ436_2738 [Planctomycetota bacterium]
MRDHQWLTHLGVTRRTLELRWAQAVAWYGGLRRRTGCVALRAASHRGNRPRRLTPPAGYLPPSGLKYAMEGRSASSVPSPAASQRKSPNRGPVTSYFSLLSTLDPLLSRTACGSPGLRFAPWCAPLPAASASRCRALYPQAAAWRLSAFSLLTSHFSLLSTLSRSVRKPPVAFRTLVRTTASGVSVALQGSLPAGFRQAAQGVSAWRLSAFPPCGSVRVGRCQNLERNPELPVAGVGLLQFESYGILIGEGQGKFDGQCRFRGGFEEC